MFFYIYSQSNGNLERPNNELNQIENTPNGVGWTYHQNNHHPRTDVHTGRSEDARNHRQKSPLKNHCFDHPIQSGVAQNGNAITNSATSPQHQHFNNFQNHATQHSSPQRNASTSSHNSSGLVSPKPHTNAITPSFAGR